MTDVSALSRLSKQLLRALDRLPLFYLVPELSDSEGYNKLLLRKQGPYKMTGVNDNTLQILYDGSDNAIFIYRATLSRISMRHCDDDPAYNKGYSTDGEPSLDREAEEHLKEHKNLCCR